MGKTKTKVGCTLAILSIIVAWPLNVAVWYLVLSQIQASQVIWTLWIINVPISLLLSIGFKLVEGFLEDDE